MLAFRKTWTHELKYGSSGNNCIGIGIALGVAAETNEHLSTISQAEGTGKTTYRTGPALNDSIKTQRIWNTLDTQGGRAGPRHSGRWYPHVCSWWRCSVREEDEEEEEEALSIRWSTEGDQKHGEGVL